MFIIVIICLIVGLVFALSCGIVGLGWLLSRVFEISLMQATVVVMFASAVLALVFWSGPPVGTMQGYKGKDEEEADRARRAQHLVALRRLKREQGRPRRDRE